jgi:hypothetical protein
LALLGSVGLHNQVIIRKIFFVVKSSVSSTPPSPPERIPLDRLDRQLAIVVGAVTFALLLRTVAPDMLAGDAGEFQFAAWRLGLAHPTGYPLYLLLGWLWQHALALAGASPAWALNAFSALTAAVGVALLYLCMAQWTPLPSARRRMAGIYSSVLFAGNVTYWSQAVIAEVYALHVVLMLALLLAVQALIRTPTTSRLLTFALLAGLALTHHALTLLWLPMLLLYWRLADARRRQFTGKQWALALLVGLVPLLLYAYIPLRSGAAASPWYHQPLGDGTLDLYHNDWASFWAFISGQSIDVGFRTAGAAWAQVPQAAWLWHYHFGWVGLAMIAAGLFWLWRTGRTAILIPTLLYVVAQQIFNLFYDIGDILVYYIPLYLVGSMWAGFGLAGLLGGDWRASAEETTNRPTTIGPVAWVAGGAILLLALRVLPLTSAQIDQSRATEARQQWEPILTATPAPNAILVSNDRNEMVPLFYLQAVEGRGQGMTGLFPGIAPGARFADIGATLATALQDGGEQPIYLVKAMPGLEVRFDLQPAMAPLVEVLGTVDATPTVPVSHSYGPLQLLGYDFAEQSDAQQGDRAEVTLYWQPTAPLPDNYVATAQLLTAEDRKITQDDHAPGGDYYPTSLWKVGEPVVVRHTLPLAEPLPEDARLLVGFYHPTDLTLLAQPLTLELR